MATLEQCAPVPPWPCQREWEIKDSTSPNQLYFLRPKSRHPGWFCLSSTRGAANPHVHRLSIKTQSPTDKKRSIWISKFPHQDSPPPPSLRSPSPCLYSHALIPSSLQSDPCWLIIFFSFPTLVHKSPPSLFGLPRPRIPAVLIFHRHLGRSGFAFRTWAEIYL